MKKLVIFSLGVAAVLCGCYNEAPTQGSIEGAQEFVATTGDASRITIESGEVAPVLKWEEADQVGIFDRTEDARRNYCYDVNLVEGSDNCDLVANDAQKVYYSVKGEASTYYAYAPYNAEANAPACDFPIALPRVQTATAVGSIAHLKDVNFMMAQPLTVESGAANLCFESAFAFVKLDVALAESASVPVKQVRIKSTSANLSTENATIDLTTEGGAIVAIEGSGEVVLVVEGGMTLSSTPQSLYCFVLPGAHAAGTLTAEVVAVNNAVATIQLPAVEFKPNRYYTQTLSVAMNDFVAAEEFKANEVRTGKVGEPVTFTFEGVADAIDLYTGEVGHDYLWKDTNRYVVEQLLMSFNYGLVNGDDVQPELFRIKVSNNYNHGIGIYTEEEILKANWTDISDLFNFPTSKAEAEANGIWSTSASNYVVGASDLDITSYVDTSKELTIGMFYRVTGIPADEKVSGHGRTQVTISSFRLNSRAEDGTVTNLIANANANTAYMVEGSGYAEYPHATAFPTFKNSSTLGNYAIFTSTFQPPVNLYAYMITKPVTPRRTNLGTDTPVVVQSETDAPQSSFSYTFNEAGTYKVVVVGRAKSITGAVEDKVFEFEIVIE